jgi:hypothetical protein
MDPIKILKRAWKILWSYKALWIFGFILALTTAGGSSPGGGSDGGSSSNNNFNNPQNSLDFKSGDVPQALQQAYLAMVQALGSEIRFWITVAVVVLVAILLMIVILTIAHYISLTAVIRMVNGYEETGEKVGIRQGFRFGWSQTSWRLFLINLLVSLPVMIMIFFLLLIGLGVFLAFASGALILAFPASIGLIGLFFMLILGMIVYGLITNLLNQFFWRACAIEQLGVFASFRRGFNLVIKNWKPVGLMWLIMIAMQLTFAIAMIFVFFLTLPVLIFTGLAGLIVAAIPALVIAGITSLFTNWIGALILGAIVGLPVFFMVAFSYLIFISGLKEVYFSTVWTLTYREVKTLESLAPAAPVVLSGPPEEIPAAG